MADRSSAGAEKASLTPSKSPMCSAVVVVVVVLLKLEVVDVRLVAVVEVAVEGPTTVMAKPSTTERVVVEQQSRREEQARSACDFIVQDLLYVNEY